MGFGDLKSDDGLKILDQFLADRSYIEGFQPSQADSAVFAALSGAPKVSFTNALRWYNHIKSYGNDTSSFPGVKKNIVEYGPAGAAAGDTKKEADADDDFDLFGSDDEDDAEAERLKQERVDTYAAKKAKSIL